MDTKFEDKKLLNEIFDLKNEKKRKMKLSLLVKGC